MTIFGRESIWLDSISSTNDHASQLLESQKPVEGYAVIANEQTNGRGQFGNTWLSNTNENLLVSYIIYPEFINISDHFTLNIFVSLAVSEVVADLTAQQVYVKWPNDIYSNDKKISGILIQNSLNQKLIKSSVIGIGINVNQKFEGLGINNASSIISISGKMYSIPDVFQKLNEKLDKYYNILKFKEGNDRLRNIYQSNLYRINRVSSFINPQKAEKFNGIIRGVEKSGKLQVEVDSLVSSFDTGQIRLIV